MMHPKRRFLGSRSYWLAVVVAVVLMAGTWTLLTAQGRLSDPMLYLLVVTHAPLVLVAIVAPLVRQRLA